jgi:two-component system response regulator
MNSIVLAEDSLRDAELIIEALKEYHFLNSVVHVRDGLELLDYLHRKGDYASRATGEPELILLDLKMPKMDGKEALRQIKSNPQFKRIPVVMMTSSREKTDLADAYDLGANAYVVKPLEFHDFVEAIRKLGSFWTVVNQPPA